MALCLLKLHAAAAGKRNDMCGGPCSNVSLEARLSQLTLHGESISLSSRRGVEKSLYEGKAPLGPVLKHSVMM